MDGFGGEEIVAADVHDDEGVASDEATRCRRYLCMIEQVVHLQVDAVGPAEADDVALVAGGDRTLAEPLTTLYFSRMVPSCRKFWQDGLGELRGDAGGVAGEAILCEALDGEPVCGRPAEGQIPLGAGVVVAHGEAAGVLEEREMMLECGGLLRGGEAGPERIEGGDVVVGRACVR